MCSKQTLVFSKLIAGNLAKAGAISFQHLILKYLDQKHNRNSFFTKSAIFIGFIVSKSLFLKNGSNFVGSLFSTKMYFKESLETLHFQTYIRLLDFILLNMNLHNRYYHASRFHHRANQKALACLLFFRIYLIIVSKLFRYALDLSSCINGYISLTQHGALSILVA